MAEELKGHQWSKLDVTKPMRRMRYPYHKWLNGSTWLLRQGEDFTGRVEDFRNGLFRLCRYYDFWVDTAVHRNQHDLYIKFIKPKTSRWERQLREWEIRWFWQRAWGADEWWNGTGSFEEFRKIREFHQITSYSNIETNLKMQQELAYRMTLLDDDDPIVDEYRSFLKTREERGYPLYHEWLEENDVAEGTDQEAEGPDPAVVDEPPLG